MLGKMEMMHKLIFVVAILDREKQLWKKEPLRTPLCLSCPWRPHTEPGEDLIPWGHDSTSAPWLTRTAVGNEDKADIADVHVAPPGSSGVVSVECDANVQQHWSPSPFAGDFDLLSGHTSLP